MQLLQRSRQLLRAARHEDLVYAAGPPIYIGGGDWLACNCRQ